MEALAPLETAREMVPDERLTLLSLGDVHLKLGHAAQALEFFTGLVLTIFRPITPISATLQKPYAVEVWS